ncbi:MAG: hypothetical protein J6Y93_01320, partial [Treponema sp.]|nr:hypothetical protein [Treponema sp.]
DSRDITSSCSAVIGKRPKDEPPLTADELKIARRFIPGMQFDATVELSRGEEKNFFRKKVRSIISAVQNAPKMYETDGQEQHPVVLHYFHPSGTHSFICEIGENGEAYGYQCLNNDWEMSEFGYLNLHEIMTVSMMELDYHFPEGLSLEQWLYQNHPEDFPDYARFIEKKAASPSVESVEQEKTSFDVAVETGNDIESVAAAVKKSEENVISVQEKPESEASVPLSFEDQMSIVFSDVRLDWDKAECEKTGDGLFANSGIFKVPLIPDQYSFKVAGRYGYKTGRVFVEGGTLVSEPVDFSNCWGKAVSVDDVLKIFRERTPKFMLHGSFLGNVFDHNPVWDFTTRVNLDGTAVGHFSKSIELLSKELSHEVGIAYKDWLLGTEVSAPLVPLSSEDQILQVLNGRTTEIRSDGTTVFSWPDGRVIVRGKDKKILSDTAFPAGADSGKAETVETEVKADKPVYHKVTRGEAVNIRKRAREILQKNDADISDSEKEELRAFEGAGGLHEGGQSADGVLTEVYTPPVLVEK